MVGTATTQDRVLRLESEGWYYTRLVLQRGRPGHLKLHGSWLSFETTPKGGRPAGPYEVMDETATKVFSVDLGQVERVSFNWLTGSIIISHATGRHIVSFVGPSSGSTVKDLGRMGRGYAALSRWQNALGTASAASTGDSQRSVDQAGQR